MIERFDTHTEQREDDRGRELLTLYGENEDNGVQMMLAVRRDTTYPIQSYARASVWHWQQGWILVAWLQPGQVQDVDQAAADVHAIARRVLG
jgi:hypothetical protein